MNKPLVFFPQTFLSQVRSQLPVAGDAAGPRQLPAAAAARPHRAEDPGAQPEARHRDRGLRGGQDDHLPLLLAVSLHPPLSYRSVGSQVSKPPLELLTTLTSSTPTLHFYFQSAQSNLISANREIFFDTSNDVTEMNINFELFVNKKYFHDRVQIFKHYFKV